MKIIILAFRFMFGNYEPESTAEGIGLFWIFGCIVGGLLLAAIAIGFLLT